MTGGGDNMVARRRSLPTEPALGRRHRRAADAERSPARVSELSDTRSLALGARYPAEPPQLAQDLRRKASQQHPILRPQSNAAQPWVVKQDLLRNLAGWQPGRGPIRLNEGNKSGWGL